MTTPPVCDYQGSEYQDVFWEKGNRAYEDAAEVLALDHLMPSGSGHLLELGAGAGRNTLRYKGFTHITLLDYSTTQLAQAIQRLGSGPQFKFVAADIYRLPFAPSVFDAATMIRTLHHLTEPGTALCQVRQCLKSNALFLLEYANKRNLKAILRYLSRRQDWSPFSREAVEFVRLNFNFHPASIGETLHESGFAVEEQVCVSYLRAGMIKKLLPLKWMVALEKVLQRLASRPAYSPSVFLRTRAVGDSPAPVPGAFFRCPGCGHPLADTPPQIVCSHCGRLYPVANGIYDFRLE